MNARRLAASGVLLASGFLVVGTAGHAAAVCDAYSQNCGGNGGGGFTGGGGTTTTGGGGGTVDTPSTLPFTGGELVLLTAVGAGALAGGTALVVAGRRKSQPSS